MKKIALALALLVVSAPSFARAENTSPPPAPPQGTQVAVVLTPHKDRADNRAEVPPGAQNLGTSPRTTTNLKPVYTKAWFWVVIAGSAAAIAGGITAGVLVPRANDNAPDPVVVR